MEARRVNGTPRARFIGYCGSIPTDCMEYVAHRRRFWSHADATVAHVPEADRVRLRAALAARVPEVTEAERTAQDAALASAEARIRAAFGGGLGRRRGSRGPPGPYNTKKRQRHAVGLIYRPTPPRGHPRTFPQETAAPAAGPHRSPRHASPLPRHATLEAAHTRRSLAPTLVTENGRTDAP